MKNSSNVPAFLTKLWTLVEDSDTNEFICWSQEGNSFLVLDEQRFAKEILPKFFKHNNMASFIRQLNMYGFRKVMHIDTGLVKQEKDGPVEFQHPYFKHGQDDLLENIKRKVSNARPEDNKIRQEDLSKILASVQSVHSKQESIDAGLETLKRENEALWREISDLRQKHAHQQQLLKKLIHFIITLAQNNRILNLKRKRPILLNGNGKKPKYIHEIYDDKVCEQTCTGGLTGVKGPEVSEDVVICDLTEGDADVTAGSTEASTKTSEQGDAETLEVEVEACGLQPAEAGVCSTRSDQVRQSPAPDGQTVSSVLQLNRASSLSLEDPVKMMDSILNENGAISQNINLLGKLELMDYLDSIDCSLEDFQAMLYEKQFDVDFDTLGECVSSKENIPQAGKDRTAEDCTDKQLVQYTCNPLLAFLDGCAPAAELDPGPAGPPPPPPPGPELLDGGLDAKPLPRSSLVRLQPLTEAEASEEALFYLCELSPARSLSEV
ncbi:heat shock factor protein 2 [Menidia menidia]